MDEKILDEIIAHYPSQSGKTLGILREIQIREKHIPMDTLKLLSGKIDVPLSRLYALVTFYSFFSLKPVGEHLITVCMGTPCHVKGAEKILESLEEHLGISEDTQDGKYLQTTPDNKFTVEIARCFGACSMAPVLRVDGELHGYVTPEMIPKILEKYGWKR
ncbi:NAD(P)H-dependent oxidoreductase subunit E [Methanospirillum stamsii]|uniref:NAD(P)H-dependent oxidoreductase subunit E n=1 Tax=Methanospirillum stamsii TaxID=1277351 RepID=A0A2V2NCK6_9EURY|nr:NAD(P)H-dependent oxidoreductase subunit E [Methanospirillum stamsii]PWR76325.1 NAD(P)H-dependent oxidoreductase subunit E [Methanospirillum stamsii]